MLNLTIKYHNIAAFCLIFTLNSTFADEVKIDNFRCGHKLIEYQMTMDDVLTVCPRSQHPKQQSENNIAYYYLFEDATARYRQYYEYKWFFESYGKFRRYVHFDNNKVVLITVDHDIRD